MAGARLASAWLVSALVVATSGAARAATTSDAEHAAAVESFRRGTQLVEAGKMQDAIDAFRAALAHEPASVGARLDLADCYEKIDAPGPAWREYALAEWYARAANDARQGVARSSAQALEPKLVLVGFDRALPAGAAVHVDGDVLAPEILARGTFALAPGAHRVSITAPGKKPFAAEVNGRGGQRLTIAVLLESEEARPNAGAIDAATPPAASSPQRTIGLAVGGVGVVGIVAGAVTGVAAVSKKATVDDEATNPAIGAARFYADRGDAKTFATVSTVALVGGGAALVAGGVLVLTAPSHRETGVSLRLVPSLGGALLDGTF